MALAIAVFVTVVTGTARADVVTDWNQTAIDGGRRFSLSLGLSPPGPGGPAPMDDADRPCANPRRPASARSGLPAPRATMYL